MIHSDNCQCPTCFTIRKSTHPELVGTYYKTKTCCMTAISVEFDGHGWIVNYHVKMRQMHQHEINWLTIKNWNTYCLAWRRDICPKGIPNKGWRAGIA